MKTTLLFFGLLYFLVGCDRRNTNYGGNELDSGNLSVIENVQSKLAPIDTLTKYIGADTLIESNRFKVYIGGTHKNGIGLLEETDSSFLVYQKIGDLWQVTDTLNYSLMYVKATDLNGDNFSDLIVVHFVTGSGGNTENVCLLFDPLSNRFKHNEYYDLPNIQYDRKSNVVFSAWWSGGSRPQTKTSYKIAGDSLIFDEGVTYIPDELSNGSTGTVEFYRMINGKRIVSREIRGRSDRIFAIFSKELWDTSDE